MTRRIWVDDWQMQCCGQAFSVGSTVEWNVNAVTARDFLAEVLGGEEARRVTDAEDHHDVNDGRGHLVRGLVRSLDAVFCGYAPGTAGSKMRHPVPGTGVVERRESADGWEKEAGDRKFVGYLVNLDAAE